MTTSRTVRRIVTLTASVALFATAPAGIAMAHENGSGSSSNCGPSSNIARMNSVLAQGSFGHWGKGDKELRGLTAAQVTAVQAARDAYLTSAKTIKEALKSALDAVRTSIRTELTPLHDAKDAARSAYVTAYKADADAATLADLKAKYEASEAAYKTAAKASMVKYQVQVDAATATAKDALATAATTYTDAIKAAFAPADAPAGLLTTPADRHFGHGYGHVGFTNNGHHGDHGSDDDD